MGKPKSEVSEKSYYKDIHFLYESLNSLKNLDEAKSFLRDILTKSELRMLKRRWHIAGLLLDGHDIRSVAYKSKTSTQTVSRVKKILDEGEGGLAIAIKRVKKKQNGDRHNLKKGSTYVKGWFR